MSNPTNIQGNAAAAAGAIAAGCRFYAGYPITPSSEIAEQMAARLPKAGGTFIQMEDELGSMAATVGASLGGVKAMTATSGPGFSLKQENLGYAAMTETPCVIVNVMRGGPSTGLPTRPAQADIMQARWGTHGDHPIIVLAPHTVREIYEETIRAFNLAEALRTPVVVLYDETIGHLVETVTLKEPEEIITRKWAEGPREDYLPYAAGADMIPAFPRPGDGYRTHTTGLTHDERGFPTQDPEKVAAFMERLLGKLETHRDLIEKNELVETDGADVLIVAIGTPARAAKSAIRELRDEGIRAGLFRPVTLWPFPEEALKAAAKGKRAVLVPEMNAGQMILEVERVLAGEAPVTGLNVFNGEPITPAQIAAAVKELAK